MADLVGTRVSSGNSNAASGRAIPQPDSAPKERVIKGLTGGAVAGFIVDLSKYRLEDVETGKLLLDSDNPRFLHLQLGGKRTLDQEALVKEIEGDDATITLSKAVAKEGILNPIVVKPQAGKYLVIDGNRRAVTMMLLHREGNKAPKGVTYSRIPAYIIPESTSATDVEVLKGVLQEGQKSWGRFNDAAYVRRLRTVYKMEYEDIADRLQLSVREVKQRIEDFALFEAYAKKTGDTDEGRFSYFADAPKPVREWWEKSDKNMQTYYDLIRPGSKNHKIRSVATAGGLRDFSKLLNDEEALTALIEDPNVDMDAAMEIARENDVKLSAPFLRQVGSLAAKLRDLEDAQLQLLKHEPKLKVDLEGLKKACEKVLKRLE